VTLFHSSGKLAAFMSGRRRAAQLVLISAFAFAASRLALHVATFKLPLSNDDAIPMIQSELLLRGEATSTLINQPYNGTLDSWLLAPALLLLPVHAAFRFYEILCAAALVGACGWLGRRAAGWDAAWAAALLAAVGTPYMALMTAVGPVPNFLVPVLVALVLGLLWPDAGGRLGRARGMAAGVVAGLAYWDSALALPALVGVVAGRMVLERVPARLAAGFLPGFLVGFSPALLARLVGAAGANSVTSARPPEMWAEGLRALYQAASGLWGLSVPLVVDGPEREALPRALAAGLAFVLPLLVIAGISRQTAPLLGWGVALAAAFALVRRTGPDEIRYLYGLTVPVLVLAGVGLARLRRRFGGGAYAVVVPIVAAWAFGHAALLRHWRDPRHAAVVWQVPPLNAALEQLHRAEVRSAYASLQFAGRLTIESGFGILASQAWNERYPGDRLRFRDEVDLDPRAAWVLSPRLSRGMPRAAGFREALSGMGGRWREHDAGDVVVFDGFEPPFDEARPVPVSEMEVRDESGVALPPAVLDRDVSTVWRAATGLRRGAGVHVRLAHPRRLSAVVLGIDIERSPLAVPWVATVDGEIVARGPSRHALQWVGGVPRAGKQALLTIVLPERSASEVRVLFQDAGAPLVLSEVFAYGPDETARPPLGERSAQGAFEAVRAGRWPEAVRLYDNAVQLEPERAAFQAALVRSRWRAAHRSRLDVESLDDGGEEIVGVR
jgi:hypothetical protein